MEDIKAIIAKNITDLRAAKGMTQMELAERLHYSDKAVSKWERGESVPEIGTLVNIANLFEVSLDFLVQGERKAEKSPAPLPAPDNRRQKNHAIITKISVALVWFVALLTYVLIDILAPSVTVHWISFLYAVPVTAILWLVFNSIWFNPRRNYFIVSCLVWSLLGAVQLTFLAFGFNIWQIYLLGLPGQFIIVMWSKLSFQKKK